MNMELKAERNVENAVLSADEDLGDPRSWWTVECCPSKEKEEIGQCSVTSWKKAHVWSYISEDACRSYLKYHLMYSGSHNLAEPEAEEIALATIPQIQEETYEDRQQYRAILERSTSLQAAAEDKSKGQSKGKEWGKGQAKGKDKGKEWGKGQAKGKDKETASLKRDVAALTSSVTQLAKCVKLSSSSASSTDAPEPTVHIRLRDLELVSDCLGRASLACNHCETLCTKLAKQFENESKVIDKAKDVVKSLVAQHHVGSVRLL